MQREMTPEVDPEDETAFRLAVREWLIGNAPQDAGSNATSRMVDHRMDSGIVEKSRVWQRKLYEAGYAGMTWPREWGGADAPPIFNLILRQELQRANVGADKVFEPSLKMFGPTLLAFGSEEQKHQHLHRMLRGEEVWCQLFSEPEAGSDLAAVATRVVRDGDEFVIDGQKTWCSRAQYADYGMLVARTDPTVKKHHGITCLVVDMGTPGIEVRPIQQMDGGDSFCEVIFTGIRVPANSLLGEWNDGWRVTTRTLMHERFTLGGRGRDGGLPDLISMSHAQGRAEDSAVRQELAEIHIRVQLMRYLQLQLESAARQQMAPGPEGSIAKLLYGQLIDRSTALGMELLGPAGLGSGAEDGSDDPYGFWQSQLLGAPSVHIAGGTDEILRNVIGERLLGLPREPSSSNKP